MQTFLQGLVKLAAPDSLSIIEESRKKFTFEEFLESQQIKQQIQPGDIVLTKTPSMVHDVMRKLTKSEYDHIAVFINQDKVYHIAPPKIRILGSNIFLIKKYSPVLIRPNLNQKQREEFLEKLMNFQNEEYDYNSITKLVGLKFLNNFVNIQNFPQVQNTKNSNALKDKKICSDLVFYALASVSDEFKEILKKNIQTLDFQQYGNFTPDDMIFLADREREFFQFMMDSTEQVKRVKQTHKNLFESNKGQKSKQNKQQEKKLENQIDQYSGQSKGITNRIKNFQEEVKIIFDNPSETENFFVKTKSLIDNIMMLANFNNIFSVYFLNKLVQYRIKQKQTQWFSDTVIGKKNNVVDYTLITLKIIYHVYQLKQITNDYKTFKQNKSKFVLHFGSLMLLINQLSSQQNIDNQNFLSRFAIPKI